MKRCPECLFIYPDNDVRCDFDNTALVAVDDAEIEAATQAPAGSTTKKSAKKSTRTSKKRGSKIAVVVVLLVSAITSLVFFAVRMRNQKRVEPATVASVSEQPAEPRVPHVIVATTPVETASPAPSPSATPKETPERVATSHSRTTVAPVSTSGPGMGKKLGGKTVIMLTSGGKIDADEVWRTRDGVWYRRNGIVTLLKHNRVKSIANQ
jgi:hypothetical protein